MAQFDKLVLTTKGKALQTKAQTGVALTFTRVGVGDGYLPDGTVIADLQQLVTEKASLSITDIKVVGDGTSRVRTAITNQGLVTGYYLREIGIFATDPDEGEILYCYANAGDMADFLPAGNGANVVESILNLITVVGNAENVTATIESGVFMTKAEKDEIDAQLAHNAINVKQYGAIGDGTDSIIALEEAVAKVKADGGNRLQLNAGTYAISRPLIISNLGIKIDCVPYKTRIVPTSDFVGAELIRFEQDEENVYKGVDLGGLLVDCDNAPCHGITVVNAYDQFTFSNVEVRYCNDSYIPFNFIQHDDQVGQTLLIENCIGYHYGDTSTKPIWYFYRYQEVNLIGTKAFGSKANTGVSSGVGYHFKDCKSITMTGCSHSFCQDGIVIEAENKNCYGFVINGTKHEEVGDCAVKTIVSNGYVIGALNVTGNVDQNGMGRFSLNGVINSVLFTTYAQVDIDNACKNVTIISGEMSKVNDNGQYTTILGSLNANQDFFGIDRALGIVSDNTPFAEYRIKGGNKKVKHKYSASPTTDYGYITELTDESNNTVIAMKLMKNYASLYANNKETIRASTISTNETGLMVLCNLNGVEHFIKVIVGDPDSAGTGYRTLRIPNTM